MGGLLSGFVGFMAMAVLLGFAPVAQAMTAVQSAPPSTFETQQGELWSRLAEARKLDAIQHPRIRYWESQWRSRISELRVILESRGHWLYPILAEVEKKGLPGELALVPLIESKLQVDAQSPRGAAGLWQFRSKTAADLGLVMDEFADDRIHPVYATRAGLTYLQQLHARFGDWPLALASYNAGQTRISRAIRSARRNNHSAEYWALSLPQESREYVPKILALARVLGRVEKMRLPWIDPALAPVAVDTNGPLDVWDIHHTTGISLNTIYEYNPHLALWTLPLRTEWSILLPAGQAGAAHSTFAALQPNERTHWRTATVRAGDSLGVIAQRWNTDVALLRATNNLKNGRLFIGQRLRIPSGRSELPAAVIQAAATENRIRTPMSWDGEQWHRVADGDTLWKVARQNRRTVAELRRWNMIASGEPLHPGQRLRVAPPPGRAPVVHPVKARDSLEEVAERYGVSVADLRRWNRLGSAQISNHRELLVFAPF